MAKAKDKQDVFDPGDVSLGELQRCREALLIGLASYGELERLSAAQSGRDDLYDDNLKPIHPELMVIDHTAVLYNPEAVSDFALALRCIDGLMRAKQPAEGEERSRRLKAPAPAPASAGHDQP